MNFKTLFTRGVLALMLGGFSAAHAAQPVGPTPPDTHPLGDAVRAFYAPRAEAFAHASTRLANAMRAACSAPAPDRLQAPRDAWQASLQAWERLSAVVVGPLLQRRSQRQIDFSPTRPRAIARAIAAAPAGMRDLETIGTPAKGLPALEWLLWVEPVKPDSPACRYAALLAEEVASEAHALAGDFRGGSASTWTDEIALRGELVNQWVGGAERLRWADMEMPLRVALTSARTADFPRAASGATDAAWRARWETLRALARDILAPLAGSTRAEVLFAAVERTDTAMQSLEVGTEATRGERILAATRELATLKQRMANDIAPALGVSIGFSDADGD